jgi:all-trans-retinol dehydrogenase (NAD+)
MRVAGCRVLVTGAGRGLGFAIAAAFARAGARVVVTDLDADWVRDAVAKLTGLPVSGYTLDVTAHDRIAEVRQRLNAEEGPIDVLVNNAGVVSGGPFLGVPVDRHLATVNVNLSGVLAVTHAFLPDIISRPAGSVVNIASASAVLALPFAATYAATKWAVLGFSESLREELRVLGHRHVGVTAVCPGYKATGLFDGAAAPRLTRWLTPEEVADAVVRAVERNREFVMLPRRVRLLHALCAGWPRKWYRAVCRGLGVSRSMAGWRGHPRNGGAAPPGGIR